MPEKTIGASFHNEPLTKFGFWADWTVQPRWNLCDAPGSDGGKVNSVGAFLESEDKVLVCTHATFRFAVDKFGVEKFDGLLIAVDEFHHVSVSPDNKLGLHLGQFIARDKVHIVAMTGSYFRGDAVAVLAPEDEEKFDTVTYTYYEQLNGYEYLKQLDIGHFFYSGSYADDILKVLDPAEKIIAGFEEIQRFVREHGRAPQHGEDREIFERLYAVRLDRLCALEECRSLLKPLDHQGFLIKEIIPTPPEGAIDDDELLAELEGAAGSSDITDLRHVRTSAEKRAAEEIANRQKCEDFDRFKPLSDPFRVWAVDHGHFFPNGPNWTLATLATGAAPQVAADLVAACSFTGEELHAACLILAKVTDDEIGRILAIPPDEWGVKVDERIGLAKYLSARRDAMLIANKRKKAGQQ